MTTKKRGGRRASKPRMPDSERPLLSARTVAKELGFDVARTCRAINRGDIPSIKIGDRLLVPRAVLDKIKAGEPVILQAMEHANDAATLYALRQARARARRLGIDGARYDEAVDTAAALAERGLTAKEVRDGAGVLPELESA